MKYHNIPTLFDNQASLINGKNIGTDTVRYIQDAGQKVAGTTYIDKNTNELYVCVTTTNSVNNDGNFSKFNLKEAFNKLDNLIKVVKYSSSGFFKEWVDVPYPNGYDPGNCTVFAEYYDSNPAISCIHKFSLDRKKFSMFNTHPNDTTWTLIFYFVRVLY